MPSYLQDFGEIRTNGKGCAESFLSDRGDCLTVTNTLNGLEADTLIRVRALYCKTGQTAQIQSYLEVPVPQLKCYSLEDIHTDPVIFIACWRGQHYINLHIDFKGSAEGSHLFGFHEQQYVCHDNGTRTLQVQLVHNSGNDPQYFTRSAYLSLPLRPLQDRLRPGLDTIQLNIPTFDGQTVKQLVY